jgi:hypothetical protein
MTPGIGNQFYLLSPHTRPKVNTILKFEFCLTKDKQILRSFA